MSPYEGIPKDKWLEKTNELVRAHPLYPCIVEFCFNSWNSILNGKINTYLNLSIRQMTISPQATGALLHDILPEYITKYTADFRKGIGNEKDIVCITDPFYSMELKTSSQNSIYGNRSYAKSDGGKDKSGYYLTINFEKISNNNPKIKKIMMGWLDHSDWIGQASETGQQAFLAQDAKKYKFIILYTE